MSRIYEAKMEQKAPAAGGAVAFAAADFPLQSLTLTFDTTDDDKDDDTVVTVSIDNHSVLMGTGTVGAGQHWDNGSHNVATLPVANGVDFQAAAQGHVNVTIHPNGHDEWHFNLRLDMGFAGGGTRWVNWAGINLAQDRPSIDLTWT